MSPVKVVAITGSGRSGSTLLDNILGGVGGAFSAGELRYLWERGLIEGRLCGCSKPLKECELWPRILETAYPGGIDPKGPADMMGNVRTRYTPAARLGITRNWYRKQLLPLVAVLDPLYPAIAEVTGADFIVDSSKLPTYTYALSMVPSVDLRVVHLVRDPRAVAHSRGREKQQLDTAVARSMTKTGPARSAADWLVWNTTIRRLFAGDPKRYVMVRYEDLVASPAETLGRILSMAGEESAAIPHLVGQTVTLEANHTVSGNPGRFRTGTIELKADEAWQTDMAPAARRIVDAITSPARRSFGY